MAIVGTIIVSIQGFAIRDPGGAQTWTNIRDQAGTGASQSTTILAGLQGHAVNNKWASMVRGILIYDVSGLGPYNPNWVAICRIYPTLNFSKFDPTLLNIYSAVIANEALLAASDYNIANWGSTPFCDTDLNINDVATGAWYEFTLNAAGKAALSSAISGTGNLVLGFRIDHDVNNIPPAWEAGNTSFDIARVLQKPELVVTNPLVHNQGHFIP